MSNPTETQLALQSSNLIHQPIFHEASFFRRSNDRSSLSNDCEYDARNHKCGRLPGNHTSLAASESHPRRRVTRDAEKLEKICLEEQGTFEL